MKFSDFDARDREQYFRGGRVRYRTAAGGTKVGTIEGFMPRDRVRVLSDHDRVSIVPLSKVEWQGLYLPRMVYTAAGMAHLAHAGVRTTRKLPTESNMFGILYQAGALQPQMIGKGCDYRVPQSLIDAFVADDDEFPNDYSAVVEILKYQPGVLLSRNSGVIQSGDIRSRYYAFIQDGAVMQRGRISDLSVRIQETLKHSISLEPTAEEAINPDPALVEGWNARIRLHNGPVL